MTDQLPEVEPCPHCREPIVEGEESWYFRGDGPPPSYAVRCDSCGAQGPYGNGKFRGDHAGAQAAAISLWNQRAYTQPFACLGGCGTAVPSPHAYCSACFLKARAGQRPEPPREYPDPVTAFENLAAALPEGFQFPTMEPSTEPLTHQEIFSAVHHHASEIVRLTAAIPAQCKPETTEGGQK